MTATPSAQRRAASWIPALSGRASLRAAAVCAVLAAALHAPAWAAGCDRPGATLGVSRVIEIDTTEGPRFGLQQYKDYDFLQPGEIVLTFDDGPLRPHTQPILNALDAQCTKATFFMVGSQAIADPDMVKRVIARGHTVGSHTWSHADLQKLPYSQGQREIELGFSAVTAAAGQPISPFFRFPYLAHTKATLAYVRDRHFGAFSIDVDSQDWKTKNATSVHRDVLRQLAELGKGIILFHDIQPATAQALPGLLEALRVKGYKVVQVKAKGVATTLPDFDALANNVGDRNKVAAASKPLLHKSMTFGAAAPSVLASAGPAHATASQPLPHPSVPVSQPPLAAVGAPPPQGDPMATGTRAARPRSPEQDWRTSIFDGR